MNKEIKLNDNFEVVSAKIGRVSRVGRKWKLNGDEVSFQPYEGGWKRPQYNNDGEYTGAIRVTDSERDELNFASAEIAKACEKAEKNWWDNLSQEDKGIILKRRNNYNKFVHNVINEGGEGFIS